MPSLKAIRTRIASVKSTQKITRAMKLVAAARLRRAQDTMLSARPYARRLEEVISDVVSSIVAEGGASGGIGDAPHPLLERRPVQSTRIVVVGSDRGLAGGYNSNLNRRLERFLVDEAKNLGTVELVTVGRKAREHFRRKGPKPTQELAGVTGETAMGRARELAPVLIDDFLNQRIDAVYVAFNEFKSAISMNIVIQQILPLPMKAPEPNAPRTQFEYEPSRGDVLATVLPLYVEIQMYRAYLEAIASFFAAQMSAMDNATKNAKEMIGRLTLEFNRSRQAAITKELMEIVGGAEALKG